MTLRRSYVDTRFGQSHLRAVSPARAAARPIFCVHPQPLCGLSLEPLLAAAHVAEAGRIITEFLDAAPPPPVRPETDH